MIPRPTTDDLIADCCRELSEHILPRLTDPTDQVRLVMLETVLRNAAVRAAHEIAWMREETAALLAYATDVRERHDDPALDAALVATAGDDSLHLADVVAAYERAGVAFAAALASAQAAGDTGLVARARELVRARVDTEKQVMATYAIVGR